MIRYSATNWPVIAPPYNTPDGWEFEKEMNRRNLRTEASTIPWLVDQQTTRHMQVAARLAEIIKHPIAGVYRGAYEVLETLDREFQVNGVKAKMKVIV